ncbi:MAG: hypothetical protein AAGN46_00270 [Acidobacteriota bacterium]
MALPEPVRDRLALLLTMTLSALALLPVVRRGWLPQDVGLLGQTAERVLAGELPHRDFIDMYTGGQAFLHAGVFGVFGVDAVHLRWLLYATVVVSVPIFFALARRAAGPWAASAAVLVGLSWGPPLYFESMPSWYNLVLAAAGAELLLRHRDSGRTWPLVAAGLCAGASLAIKSAGLLFVAAACLFFVHLDQDRRARADRLAAGSSGRIVVIGGLMAFAFVLLRFVGQQWTWMGFLHFALPALLLTAHLVRRELALESTSALPRLGALVSRAAPFLLGAALPMALLTIPYIAQGASATLLDPAIYFPSERLERASVPLPPARTLIAVGPIALVFLASFAARGRWVRSRAVAWALAIVAVGVVAAGTDPRVYQLVWFAARPLVPMLACVGTWWLWRAELSTTARQNLFLVLAVTALHSIVQFPLALAVYFAYAAPLVAVAYLHVVAADRRAPRRLHAVLAGLFFAFGALWNGLNHPEKLARFVEPQTTMQPLDLARASLEVAPREAQIYRGLVELVRRSSPEGSCILAGPGAPEIYFLTERCNPTPTLIEIFDPDYGTPQAVERLERLVVDADLPVAVVNRAPAFSAVPPELIPIYERHFGRATAIGRFLVFTERRSHSVDPDGIHQPASEPGAVADPTVD